MEPGFPGLCPRLSRIPGSSSCCVSRAVAGGAQRSRDKWGGARREGKGESPRLPGLRETLSAQRPQPYFV